MIDIINLTQSAKSYKSKVFFSFIIFAVLMLASTTIVHIYFTKQNIKDEFKIQSSLQAKDKAIYLNNFIQKRVDTINAVKNNPYFAQFIDFENYKHNTNFLFFTIIEENKDFMQLRYIDEFGDEKLRFDRKVIGSVAYKIAHLQNKKNRYYFKETKKLKQNEIFVSKIDFNIENGKVQEPKIPVVRISTPIYRLDEFKGILIANIFIDDFIAQFTNSLVFDISLIDEQNNIIYQHDKYITNKAFSTPIKHIKNESMIDDGNRYVKKLMMYNLVVYICLDKNSKIKQQMLENYIYMTTIILLITFMLAFLYMYIVSKPVNNIFKIVIDKSNQLYKQANELKQRVDEEILKNKTKDTMIEHQAKMTELGDMISNIAHQWRHPITRISLVLQNLKLFKKQNILDDERFENSLMIAQEQIEFMSSTIDNFREFYRSNHDKINFSIKQSFIKILNIIDAEIKNKGILVNIKDNKNINIYGSQNLFMQAILTIVINSKDAFVENSTKNPKIEITINQKEDKVIIKIRDNAGGINEKIAKKIFEPYFSTKGTKGTGVGLYLSKRIFQDSFNGSIEFANIQYGSCFTIIIKK